jgi:hypothetical protein
VLDPGSSAAAQVVGLARKPHEGAAGLLARNDLGRAFKAYGALDLILREQT